MNRTREIIHKHIDGDATPEDLAELEELLQHSRSAARHFADACRIDAYLDEHFGDRQRLTDVTGRLAAMRRRLPLRRIAAAAILLLIVGIASLMLPGRGPRYEVVSGKALIEGSPSRVITAGARIHIPKPASAVIRLPDGSEAELAAGSEAIFHGPSDGVRQAIELIEGAGRFVVAKADGQFRVDTALGSVTVLGTEFAVQFWSVDSPARAPSGGAVRALSVEVAEGEVQVDREGETIRLKTGESRVFSDGVRDGGPCQPPQRVARAPQPGGTPPLPLPETPSRRTERKEAPSPTAVIKLKSDDPNDWGTDPSDISNLLLWMQRKLDIRFSYAERRLDELELDATRIPMLYRTGHKAFTFTEGQRKRLRDYLLKGGCIVFDACCGRAEFADSARRELATIFPERPLRKLAADHPLYHSYYDVPSVAYTPATGIAGLAPPPLEGIDIGCRTAVVFSPVDLSCGWGMHVHEGARAVRPEYAVKLGANLLAYVTAARSMGTSLAESKVYVDTDPARADKFRIGLVRHGGDWNPDPAGLGTLLDMVRQNTSVKVSFATQPLDLEPKALATLPFIYMTGHHDFTLSGAEVAALRAYLDAGGFLLADACCGREGFDAAFRREMARVLPGAQLQRIPLNHRIYSIHHKIGSVQYTQAAVLRRKLESPGPPALEGITVNGHLAVVYSPLDVGCGWELKPHPFGVGYEWRDAIRLGINIVVYAVSQ